MQRATQISKAAGKNANDVRELAREMSSVLFGVSMADIRSDPELRWYIRQMFKGIGKEK